MLNRALDDGNVWPRRARLALIVFAAIGGVFLLAEHRVHMLPLLPWLLLAACPLMHFFMHGGHGHRHYDHGNGSGEEPGVTDRQPRSSDAGTAAGDGTHSHGGRP